MWGVFHLVMCEPTAAALGEAAESELECAIYLFISCCYGIAFREFQASNLLLETVLFMRKDNKAGALR